MIKIIRYSLLAALVGLIGYASYLALDIRKISQEKTALMEQYADVNRINNGLFNIQLWKEKAYQLFQDRASSFTINGEVYTEVEDMLSDYLRVAYRDYIESGVLINQMLDQAEKDGKINKMFLKIIKDNVGEQIKNLGLKSKIPSISKSLMVELKKNEPMIKGYITEGLSDMLFDESSSTYIDPRRGFFQRMGYEDVDSYNEATISTIKELESDLDKKVRLEYILLLSGVILSLVLYKVLGFVAATSMVTIISIVFLLLGVSLPMIDIDARLNAFSMDLLGQSISFDEQFMYYQSKSILDVTRTLIEGRGIDLKIVGVLILMFSIVIPFIKLILSTLFLYTRRLRKSNLVKTIIFYLGKWSMADVMVVAIFMAYIGFYGIISAQLDEIAGNQTGYSVETLNYSQLSPGALFFTTYCILSIITGIMIHRWHNNHDSEIVDNEA